jgi:hypothetical protein
MTTKSTAAGVRTSNAAPGRGTGRPDRTRQVARHSDHRLPTGRRRGPGNAADLANLGVGIPATTLRRSWTMIAYYHGQTWNSEELARALGVTGYRPPLPRHAHRRPRDPPTAALGMPTSQSGRCAHPRCTCATTARGPAWRSSARTGRASRRRCGMRGMTSSRTGSSPSTPAGKGSPRAPGSKRYPRRRSSPTACRPDDRRHRSGQFRFCNEGVT